MLLVMEGTNCEDEAFHCFRDSGFDPKIVHINELKENNLEDYDVLYLPGGFSAGDYVRAGAIFAVRLLESGGNNFKRFIDEGKPVVGICNGFQILTDLGLIPDVSGKGKRETALTVNLSNRFECRITFIKNTGKNPILSGVATKPVPIPVAHGEGRVRFLNQQILEKVSDRNQILFSYTDPDGNMAGYPWNPNGSERNIAGITNEAGNIIGMMPHPERLYYNAQLPYHYRGKAEPIGKEFFGALYSYSRKLLA